MAFLEGFKNANIPKIDFHLLWRKIRRGFGKKWSRCLRFIIKSSNGWFIDDFLADGISQIMKKIEFRVFFIEKWHKLLRVKFKFKFWFSSFRTLLLVHLNWQIRTKYVISYTQFNPSSLEYGFLKKMGAL